MSGPRPGRLCAVAANRIEISLVQKGTCLQKPPPRKKLNLSTSLTQCHPQQRQPWTRDPSEVELLPFHWPQFCWTWIEQEDGCGSKRKQPSLLKSMTCTQNPSGVTLLVSGPRPGPSNLQPLLLEKQAQIAKNNQRRKNSSHQKMIN